MRTLFIAGLLLLNLACGGEPGWAEYEEAARLEYEGHVPKAIESCYEVLKWHPGTEAAKQCQVLLNRRARTEYQ